jgi:hypothetical protein
LSRNAMEYSAATEVLRRRTLLDARKRALMLSQIPVSIRELQVADWNLPS